MDITAVVTLQNGTVALVPDSGEDIVIYDPTTDQCIKRFNAGFNLTAITVLRNGHLAVASDVGGYIAIFNPNTGECITKFSGDFKNLAAMTTLRNGYIAVIFDVGGHIVIYDPATGKCIREFSTGFVSTTAMTVLRNGHIAVVSDSGAYISIYDPTTGKCKRGFTAGLNSCVAMITLPNGYIGVVSDGCGNITIYNPATGERIREWSAGFYGTADMITLSNGDIAVVSDGGGELIIYDSTIGKPLKRFYTGFYNTAAMTVLPNGNIVLVSQKGKVVIYNPDINKCINTFNYSQLEDQNYLKKRFINILQNECELLKRNEVLNLRNTHIIKKTLSIVIRSNDDLCKFNKTIQAMKKIAKDELVYDNPVTFTGHSKFVSVIKKIAKNLSENHQQLILELPVFYDLLQSVLDYDYKSKMFTKSEEKKSGKMAPAIWTGVVIDHGKINLQFNTKAAVLQFSKKSTFKDGKYYLSIDTLDEKTFKALFSRLDQEQIERAKDFIKKCIKRAGESDKWDWCSGDCTKINKMMVYLKIISNICHRDSLGLGLTLKEKNILWEVHWYGESDSALALKNFFTNNTVRKKSISNDRIIDAITPREGESKKNMY